MHMKSKLLIVMCLIKGYFLFDYDNYDSKYGTTKKKSTSWSKMTTVSTTQVTDNPRELQGVCVVRYKDNRFRRVTLVKIDHKSYIAECCGGLKNCIRKKKIYRFDEEYKQLEPIERYHQVCCTGYERNYSEPYLPGGNINCMPVCSPRCASSTCVAPQQCSCFEGFIINPNRVNECMSPCLTKCEYASCVGIELCRCDFGYKSINEKYCEPVCPGGCVNGDCILPFQCKCHEGYKKDRNDPNVCVPECDNGCGRNTCIRPGVCKCPPGEEYNHIHNSCSPSLCSNDCGPGKCIPAPDRCSCPYPDYVYSKENDTCIPLCRELCYGGVCMGWDNCVCFKGFQKVDFGCMDNCKNKCGYGKCMPDGRCECDGMLYVKSLNVLQQKKIIDEKKLYIDGVHFINKKISQLYMHCIPRADNCFETGGKVLAPRICKCPPGKRYIRPNEQQIREDGLNKRKKYCLPSNNSDQRMNEIYDIYKDVDLIP